MNYLDDLNQNRVIEETLFLTVQEAGDLGFDTPPIDENGNPILFDENGQPIDESGLDVEADPATTRAFQIGGIILGLLAAIFVGFRIFRRN